MTCSRCTTELNFRRALSGFPWSALSVIFPLAGLVCLFTPSDSGAHALSGLVGLAAAIPIGMRMLLSRVWLCDACASAKAAT